MSLMSVHNLGKAYRTYRSEWHRIGRWFGLPTQVEDEQWVVRHVSFDIQPGETIGIIGQNGAGKSTLLKMITGTLQPTEGTVQTNGRIAAILELGMGFNPELTGRQNAYHAAGLMGFSADQIQKAMPQIEDFSEIGDYFDEPVRTYSSGMQMRVAFAVATAYRPEILIIDEALSVGDTYFQHKSFNRIREFQKNGTTILFVSHDKGAILSLCDRAILLSSGRIDVQGTPKLVIDYYNAQIIKNCGETIPVPDENTIVTSGNRSANVKSIMITDNANQRVDSISVGQDIRCFVNISINRDIERLTLGYQIKDRLGQAIFGTNTTYTDQVLLDCKSGEEYEFIISFTTALGPGTYSIATALVDTDGTALFENFEWNELATIFNVVNVGNNHFIGCAWIPPTIEIRKDI